MTPPPASDRVRRVWRQRAGVEYRSAALTAEVLHRLIMLGVSPDTLAVGHRIVADELAHAELSWDAYVAAGGDGPPVDLDPTSLRMLIPDGASLPEAVLTTIGHVFCCGETVAVPLFRAMRDVATAPAAVTALDRILADEAVHRAFGWDTLDELIAQLGDGAADAVRRQVPGWIDGLRRAYPEGDPRIEADELAWGLIASSDYGVIRERCVQEVILPWFRRRGLAP